MQNNSLIWDEVPDTPTSSLRQESVEERLSDAEEDVTEYLEDFELQNESIWVGYTLNDIILLKLSGWVYKFIANIIV